MKTTKCFLLLLIFTVLLSACKREWDAPPPREIPVGYVLTIDSLKNLFTGVPVRFTTDYSVYATVTADEQDGNLYKNIYVQDATGAINLRLLTSGGVYKGDSVRIYLKGTVLSSYNGMLQLDSIDVNKNIIKQAVQKNVSPLVISDISQITTSMQSKLIKLENVEFVANEIPNTWANAVAQQSANRTLTDCNGNTVIVRTSGYANYAGLQIPQGNGSLVAVVGVFNSTIQLYVRSLAEVQMNSPRCTGNPVTIYLQKNFEDNSISSGGWIVKQVAGTSTWTASIFSGNYFAKASSYNSGDANCETWLISPAIDLSNSTSPGFNFLNAANYSGPNLEVYVSTNYDGVSAPNTATWTAIPVTLSTGGFTWVNSGDIPLTAYKVANVRIGFKYTGTTSVAKTWEVDDIVVREY